MLSIWTAFLEDPNDDRIVELEKKYEELHEARTELTRISRDPKEKEIYRVREKSQNDRADALTQANEKGRIEEKIEIAKNLLKNNVEEGIIVISTGLTIEEINKLK
jgi:predicted transposase/invertase (TIGR01784 family)